MQRGIKIDVKIEIDIRAKQIHITIKTGRPSSTPTRYPKHHKKTKFAEILVSYVQ